MGTTRATAPAATRVAAVTGRPGAVPDGLGAAEDPIHRLGTYRPELDKTGAST